MADDAPLSTEDSQRILAALARIEMALARKNGNDGHVRLLAAAAALVAAVLGGGGIAALIRPSPEPKLDAIHSELKQQSSNDAVRWRITEAVLCAHNGGEPFASGVNCLAVPTIRAGGEANVVLPVVRTQKRGRFRMDLKRGLWLVFGSVS